MNKIFKTIWNKTHGSFVAVGETGKSQTKSGRVSKAIRAAITAGLIGLSGAASAIVTFDVNGWITGTEGVYLNDFYGATDSINVGLINVGDDGQGGAENALYWNDDTASFQGELTTNSLISLSIADLEFADEVYFNNDRSADVEIDTFVNGLIDFDSLDDATVTLNGTINQQINTDDVDNNGFYNIFNVDGEMFSTTLTSNGSIVNSVASSFIDQSDVELASGESFFAASSTFGLGDLNESTFTNNSSVVSTQSTSIEYNVEQELNDITTFNGNDVNAAAEGGTGSDWISYDDFSARTYEVDQKHVFTEAQEVLDSTITNNGSIVMSSNTGLDVALDLDNGSVASFDVSLGDVDAVSITDVTGNNFLADSDTYAYEFLSLVDSTFQNNGVINVSDVVDYNVAINYGGVDDSASDWGSSVTFDDGDLDGLNVQTFTSDNDATLSANEFSAYSTAAAVSIENLDSNTSTDNATITNDSSMLVSSTLNYSLGLEQRTSNDITATSDVNNAIEARAAAAGIEVVYDSFFSGSNGTLNDLTITNNSLISATANNNFSLSGQDTHGLGDTNLGDHVDFVTAEAVGINIYTDALGTDNDPISSSSFSDEGEFLNWVDNSGEFLFNTLVTNTDTILATANLSATADSGTAFNDETVFARAVGVDMRAALVAESLTDVTDQSTNVATNRDVGLNNSGSILATATATDLGHAFAAGFMAGETYYPLDGVGRDEAYYFQNSGTISAIATANVGEAFATGTYVDESIMFGFDGNTDAGTHLNLRWLNTGTINAVATSTDNNAYAYGDYNESDIFNEQVNAGTINVTAISGSSSEAHAIGFLYENEIDATTINNSVYSGTLENSGTVTVTANNDQGDLARARFVQQAQQEGSIINSGAVRVYATGSVDANAVGIDNLELLAPTDGVGGVITNSGLLATYAENSYTEDNIEAGSHALTSIAINVSDFDGIMGVVENTGGVILASSEYNHFDPQGLISFVDEENAAQFTVGVNANFMTGDGVIRNNNADGLNAGTIRAIATTDASFDNADPSSFQFAYGILVSSADGFDDGLTSNVTTIENEVGGYVGALVDGTADSVVDSLYDGYNFFAGPEDSSVAGIRVDSLRGIINNGENQVGGSREYYNATVEGYRNFNVSQLQDDFEDLVTGETVNGYTADDLTSLGLETTDLVYNIESSYQMIAGSKTGRDNYAFIDPTLNGGVTSGLRYNLAFKNLLADNGQYGDGGYSLLIDPAQSVNPQTDFLNGEINNYCYGVFEGQVFIGQADLAFYNAGRINTRLDTSEIFSSFENTDSGILQIAVRDSIAVNEFDYGSFDFYGVTTFAETTNIRVSVRDDALDNEANLDGYTFENVLVDQNGGNESTWMATSFQVQDNRLDVNFNAVIDGADSATDIVGYDTGLTTLEAAAARPTKNLGWLLDDYNLLHDADYQTRELNAYLYQLGSSDNRSDVNARLHKALPLLAGGNTLSNINLLNDTQDNIESRLVSRLDQRVGDVYMGKKNAWFKAFGNDASQSTRDSTSGYDSKALGGTFGIDNMLGDTLIGAAFTYAHNDVDGSNSFNGQEGKTRSYDASLYGSTPLSSDKKTFINFQLGGGIMDTSTRRRFDGLNCCNEVVASGQYDTMFARAGLNINHRMDLSKKTSFTPSAGLSYVYMDEDSYTERGAGDLKLRVNSNTTEQALATLGGRFDFFPTEGVRLFAGASGSFDMINDQVDLRANFVNLVDSQFTTKGIDQSPWITKARAGISVNVNAIELNAAYGYTNRSDFDNHTASLRALYSF